MITALWLALPAAATDVDPFEALNNLNGDPASGTWTLTVDDLLGGDDGQLVDRAGEAEPELRVGSDVQGA